jgi:hypothetical protein
MAVALGCLASAADKADKAVFDQKLADALLRQADEEGLDLFLERSLTDKSKLTDEAWWVLQKKSEQIRGLCRPHFPKHVELQPPLPFMEFPVVTVDPQKPEYLPERRRVVARKALVSKSGVTYALALTREGMPDNSIVAAATVFSLGELKVGLVSGSVLFADGDIEVRGTGGSVLWCTGSIRCALHSGAGLFLCDGKLAFKGLRFATVFAGSGIDGNGESSDTKFLKPNEHPLATIRLFSTSDIGLDVKQAKTELHITGVKNQSPFGKAGLEPGDVIATANGNAMTDYHAFRRLIRRAYVEETAVSLSVRRQGKPINVKVEFRKQT